MTRTGRAAGVVLGLLLAAGLADPVLAHVGSLSGTVGTGGIPLWLVASTGGALVGVSFLFATFMTDHDLIRAINRRRTNLPSVPAVGRGVRTLARVGGVATLVLIVASGLKIQFLEDPRFGLEKFTFPIMVVWAGWWAGYTMTVYLVGNSWPAINPWRTLADWLAALAERLAGWTPGRREYPEQYGVWPSVAGLLGMVFVEVVTPVASVPGLLVGIVLAYTVATVTGALLYGPDTWFERVDPIARVFRWYGRMAPLKRTDRGLTLALPTASLTEHTDEADETPFVLALLWVTTYDGLVGTPTWNRAIAPVVEGVGDALGVPGGRTVVALVLYSVAILAGYALFLWVYLAACRRSPQSADSLVRPDVLARRFLPALVPIAAGYHVAHFVGYLLNLSPTLVGALSQPFSVPLNPMVIVVPGWFEIVQLAFVVLGHVLAVWVAHGIAFETFPGRLKPIRSQYPYMAVMMFYTTVSMWIVAQPFVAPAYV